MSEKIFEDSDFYIEKEDSQIPWIKIFTKEPFKELTSCPQHLRKKLYSCIEIAERVMIEFYKPDKINIAMFGNYLPHLHVHIMARFVNDDYFPESMWGKKQRESNLNLPKFSEFEKILRQNLNSIVF